MRHVFCIIATSFGLGYSDAQEPARTDNPFGRVVIGVDDSPTGGQPIPGSVTFAFDGGTLRCTFSALNRNPTPHVAMILFPSSVEAMAKQIGIPIVRRGNEAIVIVSTDEHKFFQLTSASVAAWSKTRIAEMSGRRSSVAENSFVSVVVHALSNDLPVSLWGSDAQDALETGNWCRLFDTKRAAAENDSFGDPFSGDPFK